jgi:hypothetical protein
MSKTREVREERRMSEEEHGRLGEPEVQSLNNPFLVRTPDGREYAGAETQDQAVVLLAAMFEAAGKYGGRLEVWDSAQGVVVAVIQTQAVEGT